MRAFQNETHMRASIFNTAYMETNPKLIRIPSGTSIFKTQIRNWDLGPGNPRKKSGVPVDSFGGEDIETSACYGRRSSLVSIHRAS